MESQWFKGLGTVAAIKNLYRILARKFHPDCGGDNHTMSQINAEYEWVLKECDGQTFRDEQDQEHTYHYNATVERAIMDKIADLLKLHMDDVQIYLIGTWIWIVGATRPYKDDLKEMGCWWNGRRNAWTWHQGQWHGRHSNGSLDDLARTYGAKSFEAQDRDATAVTAA